MHQMKLTELNIPVLGLVYNYSLLALDGFA